MSLKQILVGTGIMLCSILPTLSFAQETIPRIYHGLGAYASTNSEVTQGNMSLGFCYSPTELYGIKPWVNIGVKTESRFPGKANTMIEIGGALERDLGISDLKLGLGGSWSSSGSSKYVAGQEAGESAGILTETELKELNTYIVKSFTKEEKKKKGIKESHIDLYAGFAQKWGEFKTESTEGIENPNKPFKFKDPVFKAGVRVSF